MQLALFTLILCTEVALMFPMHLQILKSHYYCRKLTKPYAKSHVGVLDHVLLEQRSNFL
jgi:hypothetical protein